MKGGDRNSPAHSSFFPQSVVGGSDFVGGRWWASMGKKRREGHGVIYGLGQADQVEV